MKRLTGASIDLSGVTLNGQRLDFDRSAMNSFTLTVNGGYGSCPFLYAFDASANAWVHHGKIIDNDDVVSAGVPMRKGADAEAALVGLHAKALGMEKEQNVQNFVFFFAWNGVCGV